MRFFLGTHIPAWLWTPDEDGGELFISARRLRRYRRWRPALVDWALDSGGFSELHQNGSWDAVPAAQYAAEVQRAQREVGRLQWAAVQDWMCEEVVLNKTGLSVEEHQDRTITSLIELSHLAPDVPWAPVVQGWREDDYMRHIVAYAVRGIDLTEFPVVGVGSICRRSGTKEAEAIMRRISRQGIRVHAFGFKTLGLRRCAPVIASSDSLAWSYTARRERIRLDGCAHSNCANCRKWASMWRNKMLEGL